MTLEELIKDHSQAKQQAQHHAEQTQRWLGIVGYLEQKIEALKVPPAPKEPKANP